MLKQILSKIRSLEFKLLLIGTGVAVVAIVAVGTTVWGILRMLNNESPLPILLSTPSSQATNGAPSTLPAGNDNQTLQADQTVLSSELSQSDANISSAKAAVDGQNAGAGN